MENYNISCNKLHNIYTYNINITLEILCSYKWFINIIQHFKEIIINKFIEQEEENRDLYFRAKEKIEKQIIEELGGNKSCLPLMFEEEGRERIIKELGILAH